MPKIPYFPFYPDDYLSSPRVLKMTDAQRGIYIHLLALSWKHPGCILPSDRESLKLLCPRSKWKNVEYVVRECFEVQGVGVANMRLLSEHTKALLKSEKARASVKIREDLKKQRTNDERTIIERSSNQNQIQIHKNLKNSTLDKNKKRFCPPRLEEVTAYCQERKNIVNPQMWFDHYTSNGWKVGKNAMKDWRAAVRKWEKNEYGLQTGGSGRETAFERRTRLAREAREQVNRDLGIRPRRAGLSAEHNEDGNVGRGPANMDSKIIDGAALEISED